VKGSILPEKDPVGAYQKFEVGGSHAPDPEAATVFGWLAVEMGSVDPLIQDLSRGRSYSEESPSGTVTKPGKEYPP
jgi:hypothetical protein